MDGPAPGRLRLPRARGAPVATRLTAGLLLVAAIFGAVACDDDAARDDASFAACGLPTPAPDVDADLVDDEFLLPGSQLTSATPDEGGFVAAINVPYSVAGALTRYRRAVERAGFEELTVDNEGFEAEIYLRRKAELAVVQIRTSRCADKSIAFVNLVKR